MTGDEVRQPLLDYTRGRSALESTPARRRERRIASGEAVVRRTSGLCPGSDLRGRRRFPAEGRQRGLLPRPKGRGIRLRAASAPDLATRVPRRRRAVAITEPHADRWSGYVRDVRP